MNNEIIEQLRVLAFSRSTPFCYSCYAEAPTGRCKSCGSDDLMRMIPGIGCEWGTDWVIQHILETELETINIDEDYEEFIRQCYPEETQVGWMTFDTVKLIKENDPVAWRCALVDYESQEESEGNIMSFDGGSTYYRTTDIEDLL